MISGVDIDECFKVAIKLATEAGEIIRIASGKKKNVETKLSNVDLVTETDKKVEDFLIKGFKSAFPDHCFIGEESTSSIAFTDAPTWIVDPVDGTMNFVHGFPHSCVSIGFTVNKEVVLGIVYNPLLDKIYSAVKGRGAYCNGRKIEVSSVRELSKSLVISEVGSIRDPEFLENIKENFSNVMMKVHGMRMMGSAAMNMCSIASGEADAYYEYSLHCWDMAGGKIIVEEAGGVVIDTEGGPLDLLGRRLICANCPEVAQALSKELTHIQLQRD